MGLLTEEEIFAAAVGKPRAERADFLNRACAGNTTLRAQVESLLKAFDEPNSLLDELEVHVTITPADCLTEGPDTRIGPYRLLEQIGEGGMGLVYMAEQHRPIRRLVALKIIKPGMDSRQVIARFEAERQALAMMEHPNIARVLDAGSTESGRPYFVMELVRGIPITEFCDQKRLAVRERLELFIQVCQAIQHAHQKGIIHRDLKPNNVLVTMHDVVPVPKVIDFGIAKALGQQLTEHTLYTGFAQLVGTPLYMSPEQAEMNQFGVDTRSDVYSLGVMLYELLTGATPFDKATFAKAGMDEMRRVIRESEPLRPSHRLSSLGAEAISTVSQRRSLDQRQLNQLLRGELDWIVMKALEKDRNRRYESASALAAEIERYLKGEPVQACPPSTLYHLRKWARRYRAGLVTAGLVFFALLMGTAVATWEAVQASRAQAQANANEARAVGEEQKARQEEQKAQAAADAERTARQAESAQRKIVSQNLYFADLRLGLVDFNSGNVARLSSTLSSHIPQNGDDDLRGWEWYYLLGLAHQDERTLMHHGSSVNDVAWSPDGRYLASAGGDASVSVYDAETLQVRRTWQGTNFVYGLSWSPDSNRVAWTHSGPAATLRVGVVDSGQKLILSWQSSSQNAPAWSPKGRYLVFNRGSVLSICDPATGSSIVDLDRFNPSIISFSWDLDEKLMVLERDGRGGVVLNTWDAISGKESRAVPSMKGAQSSAAWDRKPAAWSPDRKQFALGTVTGKCMIYATADWSLSRAWDAHSGPINSVTWSPDGTQLASAGSDRLIRVWDTASAKQLVTLYGHLNQIDSLAWEPNGRRLASGGMDGLVKVWPLPAIPQPRRLDGHPGGVFAIAWSEDLQTLKSFGEKDGTMANWNVISGQPVSKMPLNTGAAAQFSTEGKLLAIAKAAENQQVILIHDSLSGKLIATAKQGKISVSASALSPDASALAVTNGRSLEILDLRKGDVILNWRAHKLTTLSWSKDGRFFAAGGQGEPDTPGEQGFGAWIHIFDAQSRQRVTKLQHGSNWVPVTAVRWSPKEQRLVSGDDNGLIEVWEIPAGRKTASVQLHSAKILALAWSPDGCRVASSSEDGTVRIWEPVRGEELLRLDAPQVTQLEWSQDTRRLAAATADGSIYVWDASAGYEYARSSDFSFVNLKYQIDAITRQWEAGRRNEARAEFARVLQYGRKTSNDCPAWVLSGVYRFIQGVISINEDPSDLMELVTQLTPHDPSVGKRLCSRAYERLVIQHHEAGRFGAVESAYRKWIQRIPSDVDALLNFGNFQSRIGNWNEAKAAWEQALKIDPDEPMVQNNLAWKLATDPDQTKRDPIRAVELATKASTIFHDALTFNTFGVAHYRAGNWQGAIEALNRSEELSPGKYTSFNAFFLAMAHWQLDQKEEARKWYDQSVEWMEKNKSKDAELLRFRAEAAELLGVKEEPQ